MLYNSYMSDNCKRCRTDKAGDNGLCHWCQTAIADNMDERWIEFKAGFCLSVYDMLVAKKNSLVAKLKI